jgi:hypothetical protein
MDSDELLIYCGSKDGFKAGWRLKMNYKYTCDIAIKILTTGGNHESLKAARR